MWFSYTGECGRGQSSSHQICLFFVRAFIMEGVSRGCEFSVPGGIQAESEYILPWKGRKTLEGRWVGQSVGGRQMLEEEAGILKAGPPYGGLSLLTEAPSPSCLCLLILIRFPFLAASNEISRILAPNPRLLPQHSSRGKGGGNRRVSSISFLASLTEKNWIQRVLESVPRS